MDTQILPNQIDIANFGDFFFNFKRTAKKLQKNKPGILEAAAEICEKTDNKNALFLAEQILVNGHASYNQILNLLTHHFLGQSYASAQEYFNVKNFESTKPT